MSVVEPQHIPSLESADQEADRYEAVRQYSLVQILGVWAAAAVPMGVLAWIVAPWLGDRLGGDEPLAQALLILLTAGLIWQFVLVLILVRRELGGLQPASAVEHSQHPRRRDLPYRLSLAAFPERVDGDHRALIRASHRNHVRPHRGTRLGLGR